MPMALRPGTTATRADSALIERAMSSARPMTRDDLMPGAGSSSYSVTTGPGLALAIRGARRGEHVHRRQFELVGRFALGRAGYCLLARRASGRLLLILIDLVV